MKKGVGKEQFKRRVRRAEKKRLKKHQKRTKLYMFSTSSLLDYQPRNTENKEACATIQSKLRSETQTQMATN